MKKRDELDELIDSYESGKMSRRAFVRNAVLMGLTLSSIDAFLASSGKAVQNVPVQTPPQGKPADVAVGYFPSWIGGWSGAVIKHRELWKKHLPAGSKVDWDVQVVGPPIVTNMLANKSQIGYMADMPAIVATTKRQMADIRITEVTMYSDTGICSILMVGSDAPHFDNYQRALEWLNGKTIGLAGKGSCQDRFISIIMKNTGLTANLQFLDPTIIKTSLQSRKIDAAVIFQPHVAQILESGIGRVALIGSLWGSKDISFVLMRKDFIDTYPEVAKGWIKADIEALKFMLDYPYETVKIMRQELPGFSTKTLWQALYGLSYDKKTTGFEETIISFPITFNDEVINAIHENFKWLKEKGAISVNELLPGSIYADLVDAATRELKVKTPLGHIKGLPLNKFKG